MVSLAHKFAFESTLITAEAISALARPDLARRYQIFSTPYTVLNGHLHLKGPLSEARLLEAIQADS